MMPVRVQYFAIPSFAVFQEFGDPGDSRGGSSRLFRYIPISGALSQLLGHFESLAPGLQLGQSPDVPEEIGHVLLHPALNQRIAESPEPGFLLVAVFSETSFGHWMEL